MKTIQEIIAMATPVCTSNPWIGGLTNGRTQAILTFGTRQAAGLVQGQLENAGAEVTVERSPYKEYILRATWQA